MTIYAMVGTVGGALFGAMPAGGGTGTFFVNAETDLGKNEGARRQNGTEAQGRCGRREPRA
jgi:hypothetical protein